MTILEGLAHHGDVTHPDYRITGRLDRHVTDIFDRGEEARHLDSETPGPGIEIAGRHQPIGTLHALDQFTGIDTVAFEFHRIDDDFNNFPPVADQPCPEHSRQSLDGLLKIPRGPCQDSLRGVTGKGDDER